MQFLKRKFFAIVILLFSLTSIIKSQDSSDPNFERFFKVTHIAEGDGENFPPAGSKVSVHYTGTFPDTGEKFDSSLDRNQQFVFTLKKGEVIKCWDEVVSRMTIGEKIKVICPYRLAYGERGISNVIPPSKDLAFEIELFSFDKN
jgi:FK506-binding protein 1